jgi:hypothetical protein
MGYDLYGMNPRNPAGEYFRSSIWTWPMFHSLIAETQVLGEEALESICYNDGYEISNQEAIAIGNGISAIINNADNDAIYAPVNANESSIRMANMGNQLAEMLTGQGVDVIKSGDEFVNKPYIQEFVDFCLASGGFNVY